MSSDKSFLPKRLFLKEEIELIKEMQYDATEFKAYYPRHTEWLEKALKEVDSGKRAAFGVFRPVVTGGDTTSLKIVGCIILKRQKYSGIIELKNLFVEIDQRGKKYGSALCKEAEDYAKKSGANLISTEVPASETGTVNFLFKQGYAVVLSLKSRFKSGDLIYKMEKRLVPYYDGDPFDIKEIQNWIMSKFYKLDKLDSDNRITKKNISLYKIPVEAKLKEQAPNVPEIEVESLFLEKGDEKTLAQLMEKVIKKSSLIVFCNHSLSDLKETCEKNKILLFDRTTIKEKFNKCSVLPLFPFCFKDIGGMIVEIKSLFFERIKTKSNSFVYFKGGSVGKYLQRGDTIAFYVTEKKCIKGIASVVETRYGSPSEMWSFGEPKNRILSQKEFNTFSIAKEQVIGLRLNNFKEINDIEVEKIEKDILEPPVKEITWDIGHTYLSKEMVKKLNGESRERSNHTRKPDPNNSNDGNYEYDVFLSYAGEDKDKAEKLYKALTEQEVKVFFAEFKPYEYESWGENLITYFPSEIKKSGFFIPMTSSSYREKKWPKKELEHALTKAFEEDRVYILPLRLDDTEIPGIPSTTRYLDYREKSIQKLVEAIIGKLKQQKINGRK